MQYYFALSSENTFRRERLGNHLNHTTTRDTVGRVASSMTASESHDSSSSSNGLNELKKSVTFSSNIASKSMENTSNTMELNNLTNGGGGGGVANLALDQDQNRASDEQRQFDLVIFAASGCVGKFLVEELALVVDKQFNSSSSNSNSASNHSSSTSPSSASNSHQQQQQQQFAQQALRRRSVPSSSMADEGIRWAVAGRSAMRLSETLCRAELSTGIRELSRSVPVVLADLNHRKSLADMCQKTKLVINCAGPYSELGAELLIKTCIDSKTNYLDLCHEVTFIELMRQKYSLCAREANVFILNGCGFQSMSAEMGLNFTKQVADGTIDQVKIILSLSDTSALIKSPNSNNNKQRVGGIISPGMWNSLLVEKAQEISIEDRLTRSIKAASREQEAYRLAQEQQIADDQLEAEQEKLLKAVAKTSQSQLRTSGVSSSSGKKLVSSLTSHTKSLTAKILERKDTQSLVRDLVQFRNRNVTLAWPLRLIQGFQGKSGRGFCWPIDTMSSDESQLIRSEMNTYELHKPDLSSDDGWRPIRCSTFLSVKNFTQLCLLFVWLFVFQILVKLSPFRYAMRKFPQLMTLGHVASSSGSSTALSAFAPLLCFSSQPALGRQQSIERDSLSHIKFCQTFIAYGTPNDDDEHDGQTTDLLETTSTTTTTLSNEKHLARKQVRLLVSRVVGPEPNHVATATLAIQAALTMLTERDHLPSTGGVLTPGAAFAETNIIYQLRKRNIKFEVLRKA